MKYKIGDLVEYHSQLFVVIYVGRKTNFIRVKNIVTGDTSGFPPTWLTKIKTDNL